MIRVLTYLFDALRYPVALVVVFGLASVLMTQGIASFGSVMTLIASGIVVNGAALLALVWMYRIGRRWWDRRTAAALAIEITRDDT